MRLLLDLCADDGPRNLGGQTSLNVAAYEGLWRTVRLLPARGSDIPTRGDDDCSSTVRSRA